MKYNHSHSRWKWQYIDDKTGVVLEQGDTVKELSEKVGVAESTIRSCIYRFKGTGKDRCVYRRELKPEGVSKWMWGLADKKNNDLPIALFNSARELAEYYGVKTDTIYECIHRSERLGSHSKYFRVLKEGNA